MNAATLRAVSAQYMVTKDASPGRTVTSQSASRGSSFRAPLKKPVSPEKTTAKRRQSGFSRMQAGPHSTW